MQPVAVTLCNGFKFSRGNKDSLVLTRAEASDTDSVSVALSLGSSSYNNGANVFLLLLCNGEVFTLDPSKSDSKYLFWSKGAPLSEIQLFKMNILSGQEFNIGCSFALSYQPNESSSQKYLSYETGADPAPVLADTSTTLITLTADHYLPHESEKGGDEIEHDVTATTPGGPISDIPGMSFITIYFDDGPLGVKLKRDKRGKVYVQDIVEGSQAINKDVQQGDVLWNVGDLKVGDHPIDDVEFAAIIATIRDYTRPLPVLFGRTIGMDKTDEEDFGVANI